MHEHADAIRGYNRNAIDGIRARVHLDRARIQAIYQKKAIRQAERDPISAPRCTCIQVFRVPASRATR